MHKIFVANVVGLLILAFVLAACGGYTESGVKTTSNQGTNGGNTTVEIGQARGSAEKSIEVGDADLEMQVDVTLAVGKGTYKVELLGKDKKVTLALEARDGETVSDHGHMVTDSFGEARYRVTALQAEKVTYVLEYTYP